MINVLVVEDDQVTAEAHRLAVQRLAGFQVAGVAHSGAEALRCCHRGAIDVVLLDFYLPDTHGLTVCRALRAAGSMVHVIALTSARDVATVQAAKSLGITQYLLKPFTFASLRDKLEHYAEIRQRIAQSRIDLAQAEVDRILAPPPSHHQMLPKGITGETLQVITEALIETAGGLSAAAAADVLGLSRVTARRYLEYLATNGLARRMPQHGRVGRPELQYLPVSTGHPSDRSPP
ncbi:MAG: response regulator [Pseudonocardiaceae bacterium]